MIVSNRREILIDLESVTYDTDAQAFIDVVGTLTTTQEIAINDLVIDLKADNLWNKMDVIYPFVGGTASSHKWNLKDPRDLDAAHRIEYYTSGTGSVNHDANGLSVSASDDLNGAIAFTNYFLSDIEPTDNTPWDANFSVYLNLEVGTLGRDGLNIAFWNGEGGSVVQFSGNPNDVYVRMGPTFTYPEDTTYQMNSGATGFFHATTGPANDQIRFFATGSEVDSSPYTSAPDSRLTDHATSQDNKGIAIGGNHNGTTPPIDITDFYGPSLSTGRIAFYSIGNVQTDATDASNLYNTVQKFQTALGRNV